MTNKKTTAQSKTTTSHSSKRIWKWLGGILGAIIIVVIITMIAFRVSPWPGSLVIRYFFDKGGRQTAAALQKHVPSGVDAVRNVQYHSNDKDAKLDVFYPHSIANADKTLPTIVWVHGGAWVSGSKETVANYLQIIAAHGYTVVGIDYSIAPGKKYPTPVIQTNEALSYLQKNASQYHIDSQQFVLAGDSAGSQIAAQVATIISNPSYAKQVDIAATLPASHLKAVVLNCGAYDLALPNYNGSDGKFLKTVLWAYAGTKDFLHDKNIQHASVVDYVNGNFPPAFITAGNVDPLEPQSREFARKLASLNVPVDPLFYPKNHQPELQHEYQFNLDIGDGQQALQHITAFLQKYVPSE